MAGNFPGGCLCGAVRFELAAPPRALCFCHCNSCRRATGAVMVPWGTVSQGEFRVTHGTLAEYRSSPPVRRGFCRDCGGSLTYRDSTRAAEIDVLLVSLDDPRPFKPERHVWVADKLPWVAINDGLPQFARGTDGAPLT